MHLRRARRPGPVLRQAAPTASSTSTAGPRGSSRAAPTSPTARATWWTSGSTTCGVGEDGSELKLDKPGHGDGPREGRRLARPEPAAEARGDPRPAARPRSPTGTSSGPGSARRGRCRSRSSSTARRWPAGDRRRRHVPRPGVRRADRAVELGRPADLSVVAHEPGVRRPSAASRCGPRRASAEWCLKGVDQCWSQKEPQIRRRGEGAARAAYELARAAYRTILAESRAGLQMCPLVSGDEDVIYRSKSLNQVAPDQVVRRAVVLELRLARLSSSGTIRWPAPCRARRPTGRTSRCPRSRPA